MALIDMIQQHLGQNEIQQISNQLGIDPATAQKAVSAALPMILGGLAGHAQQPGGAEAIKQAAAAHEDAPANVSSLLQAGPPADTGGGLGGLLGRVLGQHTDTVQQGVQQASGLDSEKSRKLLMMLAPIVLGVLARKHFGGQNAEQASPGQLAGELRQEAQTAQQQAPHVGGLLGKVLGMVETPRS
jgi:hypothetical protein